jgi:hypothetical protein
LASEADYGPDHRRALGAIQRRSGRNVGIHDAIDTGEVILVAAIDQILCLQFEARALPRGPRQHAIRNRVARSLFLCLAETLTWDRQGESIDQRAF